MKRLICLLCVVIICFSCDYSFDLNNPSVKEFVALIKNNSYDYYKISDTGEKLYLIMPEFTSKDIPDLLKYASDTRTIAEYPLNPVSSISPYYTEKGGLILSECLLWTIEGIRIGSKYGSLVPILRKKVSDDPNVPYQYLDTNEILIVKDLYDTWWKKHGHGDWREIDPLEGSVYSWD